MRKPSVLLLSAVVVLNMLFSSCKGNDDVIDDPTKTVNVVSQFVYDGMSLYYLWSSEMERNNREFRLNSRKIFPKCVEQHGR